ncbi:hypothetical protein F5Y16DRAFT_414308 [Xylariaceae sp. FL0255]|nr:hypothetical protein F5Y16DRAFT_414308 [Xylariaceae sp. FL0255]
MTVDGSSPAFLPPEEHARRQRLIEQYAELTSKRSTLFDAFSKAQANRHDIQNLRHIKDEAERKFITAIETALATSPAARQLFKSLQDARVQCQEAESRFYDVFEELKEGHEDVDQQERRFYLAAIGVPDAPLVQTRKSENPASEDDFLLRGISGDRPEIIHPLFEKLRDAFRELQLARELLVNTRMKRDTLLLKKSQPLSEDGFNLLETYGDAGRRKALELKQVALMTEADKEQLQDYTNLEQEAKADIELYTEKVKRLQIECRDKGVLPTDSIFQEDVLKIDPPQEEIRLSPGAFESNESGTLAHPVFPLLLSNPTHVLNERFPQTALQSLKVAISLPNNVSYKRQRIQDAAREANIHSLLSTMKSEDKDTFVNHWLLHKLHQSAMEAELLWTTFRTRLKILDIDRWQRDVLQFWWRDGESSSDFSIGGDRDTNYPSNSARYVLSLGIHSEAWQNTGHD